MPPAMPIYKPLKVGNLYAALAVARSLCQCHRKSFVGVQWREGAEVRRMTWAEVDSKWIPS